MKNKILYLVMLVIIIIGIITIATKGFVFGIDYRKTKMIELYLGKEFNIEDIKEITNEVLKQKEVKIKKVGEFENTVAIIVDEISDEELELLIQKTNEKYELEILKKDVLSVDLANIKLKDIIKPYIKPLVILTIITLIYLVLIFKKLGVINIIVKYLVNVILPEITIISLVAIIGVPIKIYLLTTLVIAYVILLIINSFNCKVKLDKIKIEEDKNK